MSDAEYQQMRPYLQLAQRLASLLAQLSEGNLVEWTRIRRYYRNRADEE